MENENFPVSNSGIFCLKQCHSLVFTKLAEESAAVDPNTTDLLVSKASGDARGLLGSGYI
jgi:hypothetical protein